MLNIHEIKELLEKKINRTRLNSDTKKLIEGLLKEADDETIKAFAYASGLTSESFVYSDLYVSHVKKGKPRARLITIVSSTDNKKLILETMYNVFLKYYHMSLDEAVEKFEENDINYSIDISTDDFFTFSDELQKQNIPDFHKDLDHIIAEMLSFTESLVKFNKRYIYTYPLSVKSTEYIINYDLDSKFSLSNPKTLDLIINEIKLREE
jgi:hypothetical protein